MTKQRKEAQYAALTTAAAMIDEHVGGGLSPEDLGGIDIEIYQKACSSVAKMLNRKAEKLILSHTNNKAR